ncbi:FxSxx-COOH system tetratricopeptide repeat protein [Sphaerisporangium fuscum]|uniref:FxSxx-COOH system tetratricopeptide repeat protein n=1 Tax=Sphaerisporangium fuscum TaxID=2835868 RepID=UPI001BDD75CB|nr:FxSxx-COOH system tetratricopeptide repeat protein [Sphaerisporangium fuscum]
MNDVADTSPTAVSVLFCSTSDNIGRTTTIINVALILAGAGLEVLIVDAHRSTIRADHYLRPFITPPAPAEPPSGPRVVTVRSDETQLTAPIAVLRLDTTETDEDAWTGALDAAVRAGTYDYVLIDAPGQGSGIRPEVFADRADTVVACFPLNARSIESCADLAGRLQQAARRPLGVVALGIKADSAAPEPLQQARGVVQRRFSELGPGEAAPYVEIPYTPAYAYTDTLAVQNEPPGRPEGLRAAYERLARELTDGKVGALREVTLVYSPRHRVWAEWARAQLERFGLRVKTTAVRRFGGGENPRNASAVLVISPAGLDDEAASLLRRMPGTGTCLAVVDDLPLPEGLSHHELLDLRGLTEPEAVAALRRALRVGGPSAATPAGARYPAAAVLSNVPVRVSPFVGRDDAVEQTRDVLLAPGTGRAVCTLSGPPGIGKTEIAMEYCHRFGGAYDIVWWLAAGSEQSIRQGLGELAAALAIPTAADAAEAALRHLSSMRSGGWLLVYDGAPDAAGLPVPTPATGEHRHVVVTSRTPVGSRDDGGQEPPVEIGPFTPSESVALLRRRVPELLTEQAELVGEHVGDIPLVLDLAGAWIAALAARLRHDNVLPRDAVRQAAERFGEGFTRKQAELLDRDGTAPPARVMLELTLDNLPDDIGGQALRRQNIGGAATLRLLEVCALLSPDGVDLALLRSSGMLALLARAERLDDPLMVDVMLRTMCRYGLVQVDLGRPALPVRLHRLVGELVRQRMGPRLDGLVADLRLALASWIPLDGDDAGEGHARVYAELERHLDALRPWEDTRPEVRRWLLRQLGRLLGRDDRLARDRVKEVALLALGEWHEESEQTLRLYNLLAQVSRLRGDYRDNEEYSFRALRSQRAVLGVNHPRTLLTAGAHAAALRAMGEFEEARDEERDVLRELRELLGANHPQTGNAMHNLAISEALMGDPRRALQLAGQRHRLRVALNGEADAEAARTAVAMARYHRDLGELRESYNLLKDVLGRRGSLGSPARPRLEVLRAESGLAVTERRLGAPYDARERDERILEEFRAHQGDRYLGTLICRASLAADLNALGKYERAADEITACWSDLRATLGPEHPYTQVCEILLGAYLRNSGVLSEAAEWGRRALTRLGDRLGPSHPWTLAAAVALANTMVLRGELALAAGLEERARAGFHDAGLPGHPNARLLARNLADTRSRMAAGAASDRLVREDIDLEIPGL